MRRFFVTSSLLALLFTSVPVTPSAEAQAPPTSQVAEQIVKVRLPDGSVRWETVASSRISRFVETAIPVSKAVVNHRFVELGTPNDFYFDEQWNFTQIGLEAAWDTSTGSGVTVAVLDSGITPGPDLACRSLVSPFDAFSGGQTMDDVIDRRGHGTHVSATVGECSNNAIGLAGIGWDVAIMPVKVLGDDGSGTSLTLANGIIHAVANGADVINLSLGFDCEGYEWPVCSSPSVDAEIQAAIDAGVVIVAAAGNGGVDALNYPAVNPNVIAVGASNSEAQATSYSSGGPSLDLVAPGGDGSLDEFIYQETIEGGGSLDHAYLGYYGTSMSSPHVAGTVALMLEGRPNLTPLQVKCILIDTSSDLGPEGWDPRAGWGEIRADAAVAHSGEFFTDVSSQWFEGNVSRLVSDGIIDGYPDCSYRPFGDVTRAESVKLLVEAIGDAPSSDPGQVFSDVFTWQWHAGYIERGSELGWATGYEDGTFLPDTPITRIDLAVFATMAMGFEPVDAEESSFSDVSPEAWYHPWLESAKVNGVIEGYPDGTFRPETPVNRAEAATIIHNILYP